MQNKRSSWGDKVSNSGNVGWTGIRAPENDDFVFVCSFPVVVVVVVVVVVAAVVVVAVVFVIIVVGALSFCLIFASRRKTKKIGENYFLITSRQCSFLHHRSISIPTSDVSFSRKRPRWPSAKKKWSLTQIHLFIRCWRGKLNSTLSLALPLMNDWSMRCHLVIAMVTIVMSTAIWWARLQTSSLRFIVSKNILHSIITIIML